MEGWPELYAVLEALDLDKLQDFPHEVLVSALPSLVRSTLIVASAEETTITTEQKHRIWAAVSLCEQVNSVTELWSEADASSIRGDLKTEERLRRKTDAWRCGAVANCERDILVEFERISAGSRLRLVLAEFHSFVAYFQSGKNPALFEASPLWSESFYFPFVADIVIWGSLELPDLFPLSSALTACLLLERGEMLLCQLLLNQPHLTDSAVTQLVTLIGEKSPVQYQKLLATLDAVLALSPARLDVVTSLCDAALPSASSPLLDLRLALLLRRYESADVALADRELAALLSASSSRASYSPFARHLRDVAQLPRDSSRAAPLRALRESLVWPRRREGAVEDEDEDVELIQLVAKLRLQVGLSYSEGQKQEFTALLERCDSDVRGAAKLVALFTCSVLDICPPGGSVSISLLERWLRQLMYGTSEDELLTTLSAAGELVLSLSLLYHSHQADRQASSDQISRLLSSELGFSVSPTVQSHLAVRDVFAGLLPATMVARSAIRLQVTEALTSRHTRYLSVYSMISLLKNRVFSDSSVSAGDWVLEQLKEAKLPLHPQIVELIECYVTSCVLQSDRSGLTNTPLSVEQVAAVIRPFENLEAVLYSCPEKLTMPVLILFYMLEYRDRCIIACNQTSLYDEYEKLIERLCTQILLLRVAADAVNYSPLQSSLTRLLAARYPHLCEPSALLLSHLSHPSRIFGISLSKLRVAFELNDETLADTLVQCSELPLSGRLLVANELCSKDAVWCPILRNLAHEDSNPLRDSLVKIICQLLRDTVQLLPVSACCQLLSALLSHSSAHSTSGLSHSALSHTRLLADPLIVLRVAPHLLRSPLVLPLVLALLRFYLAASRAFYSQKLAFDEPPKSSGEISSADLRNSFLLLQNAAVVHLLLDLADRRGYSDSTIHAEICDAVCGFVHELFINDKSLQLADIVHKQGYPVRTIEHVMTRIPSIHICFDFLPDMLVNVHKHVFAVHLLAALCQLYQIPKALAQGKLALDTSVTLLVSSQNYRRLKLIKELLRPLIQICRVFPTLNPEMLRFLQLARNASITTAACNGEVKRIKLTTEKSSEVEKIIDDVDSAITTLARGSFLARQSDVS